MIGRVYIFALWLFTLSLTGCAHTVGGKSIDDVFTNPQSRALAQAACSGSRKKLQALVESGTNVNATGLDDVSVLIWSLSCKNITGIRALLDNGANPNHTIRDNLNPVSIAASYENRTDILRAIIEAGGNVNAVSDSYEETALMTAFSRGIYTENWNNYNYLLEAGADVNFVTSDGRSIGRHARNYHKFCKLIDLIDRGYTRDLQLSLNGARNAPALIEGSEGHRCRAPLIEKLETRMAELNSDKR